jgi:hypothetical protein
MEANMREKRSLALCNELKSSWEREKYIDICTFDEKKVLDGGRWTSGG